VYFRAVLLHYSAPCDRPILRWRYDDIFAVREPNNGRTISCRKKLIYEVNEDYAHDNLRNTSGKQAPKLRNHISNLDPIATPWRHPGRAFIFNRYSLICRPSVNPPRIITPQHRFFLRRPRQAQHRIEDISLHSQGSLLFSRTRG
jgi:hypothetical protein